MKSLQNIALLLECNINVCTSKIERGKNRLSHLQLFGIQ